MWSLTFQLMKKSIKMLIPAGIAIMIGTAFIASTFLFGNSLQDAVVRHDTAGFGNSNYSVDYSSTEVAKSPKYTMSDIHLDEIRKMEGVTGVATIAGGSAAVSHNGKTGTVVFLQNPWGTARQPLDIIRGKAPDGNNQAALPANLASRLNVKIGDTVTLKPGSAAGGEGRPSAAEGTADGYTVTVTGLTDDPEHLFSQMGGCALLSANTVMQMDGSTSPDEQQFSGVFLNISPDREQETVEKISRLLPKYVSIKSRAQAEKESLNNNSVSSKIITTFLLVFGVLAMFVAALVIANTFQVLVAQRRRTLAILRTVGARRGQLYRSVIAEAFILGLLASCCGVLLSIAVMGGLSTSGALRGMSSGSPVRFIFSWTAAAVPVIFGAVITVFAALGSAYSATRVTPLEALRPIDTVKTKKSSAVRAVFGILMVLGGIAASAIAAVIRQRVDSSGTSGSETAQYMILAAMAGCMLIFVGLIITAVFWLPTVMKGAGYLVSLMGPSGAVAHGNIQKNPRRVAATGTALLIGVTLVATISTGAASAKATLGNSLDDRYSIDMTVSGNGIDKGTVKKIASVKGVKKAVLAPTATGTVRDSAGHKAYIQLIGVNGTQELRSVMRADLPDNAVTKKTMLLPSSLTDKGWKTDTVQFTQENDTDGGSEGSAGSPAASAKGNTVTLSATSTRFQRVSPMYAAVGFVDISYFTGGALKADAGGYMVLTSLDTAHGDASETISSVKDILSDTGMVNVMGTAAKRQDWERRIDQLMLLLVGLLAVAVLIALIGVANTLSLSVIERTRESATLRAIGMTRGQLRASLAFEALLLALVGGLLGIVLGTLFGWLGSYMVFSDIGRMEYRVSWGMDALVLVISAAAALLASVLPARRAVSTPPVEALAEA